MSTRQTLLDQLAILRLPAFREALEQQFASPDYDQLPFEERLALLVDHECVRRGQNRVQRRIRQARFQQTAWVQEIDFSAKRGLQRQQVLQLAQATWIAKRLNLIILGPTGAGKTFLGCALGRAACQHDLTVRYFRLPRLFQAIKIAQIEGDYPRFIKPLVSTQLLILDDWLRDKPSLADTQTLLDILDDRYARVSTMLISQFPIDTWHSRFPDPTLADAIMDRLIHNAHRINLKGDSQRKVRAESALSST
jgi:DNA replication protein DnaC